MDGFNYKKATQALNLMASLNNNEIDKMKAIKLIWLADRLHLRKYGRTITGDIYFALPYGPVPSATLDIVNKNVSEEIKSYTNTYIDKKNNIAIKSISNPNLKVFSKSDLNVIYLIFENYGDLSSFELSKISHEFPEWKNKETQINNGCVEINMLDFFENVKDESGLFLDDENYLEATKDIFKENLKLSDLLNEYST